MLIHYGVTPYLVFDGDYLPSKAATEHERATKREESKKLGLELHRLGKISQAHLELQKAVDVTPEMARQLIEELKNEGIQYVVAPYEADAQLAYLEQKGIIHGILSEDSDLLVFGAKCLLTKLDQYGDCIEISRSDFTSCREISLVGWTDADFRRMAILSGCDYLANINKMGLKTAYRLVRKHKKIEKILRMLQFDGQFFVPAGYLEAFQRAELTFLHQRVFCPETNSIVTMTPLDVESCNHDLSFLGTEVEQGVALGVVRGILHPMTKKPIVVQRSISQISSSPWTNKRRQIVGTPSNPKPNKSIDAFFKAQRTPLAELDPNSFTPSPSQRTLLQQQSSSWLSSPAPVRPGMAKTIASVPKSEPRAPTVRVALGTKHKSILASNPLKKRRLCSDLTEADKPSLITDATDAPVERSPFFAPSLPDHSPSVRGSQKTKACKTTSFNIWSDDSIEEVMAELPDMSQRQVSPRRNVENITKVNKDNVERDMSSSEACVGDTQPISQRSATSESTVQSGISVSNSSTDLTDTALSQQAVAKSLDAHVQCDLAVLRKESLYQTEPERCRIQRLEISKNSAPSIGKSALHTERSMTPLQRLGATALKRSMSCNAALPRLTIPQGRPPIRHRSSQIPVCMDISGLSRQREHTPSKSVRPVGCSEDTMPIGIDVEGTKSFAAPKKTPARDESPVKGSEDAMIPDSEAESDVVSDGGRENSVLCLGQFAFTG
ncbi:MAG: hypothetical protein LQ337_003962 [Flavoplaca oasis]|nr:MAG: hypothetical protein LQ337_003962 [Flavoplaca oasis]